jgi:hypothetical protein
MALVATLLASNILAIIGAKPAKSLATLLAFLTSPMALCNPSSAVMGSIIFAQPFSIQGTLLCDCKHHPSTPTAHSGIQLKPLAIVIKQSQVPISFINFIV